MVSEYRVKVAAVVFLMTVVPTFAHHSFQAEFDNHNCTDLKGTLTKVDWDNPHMYFYMNVKDVSGKETPWSFEGKPLAALQRIGIHKVTLTDNIGKEVSVRACLAKSGEHKGTAERLTTADGLIHSIGTEIEKQNQ